MRGINAEQSLNPAFYPQCDESTDCIVGSSPECMKLPKISIITPSLNQGQYLEAAIRSVINQDYPALEYIVIDGGSDDQSVELIRSYEHQLASWVSEPDRGQYDAINRGFGSSTGDVLAWINADDIYLPGALHTAGAIFASMPHVAWLTSNYSVMLQANGVIEACGHYDGFSRQAFLRGENLPGAGWPAVGCIPQESTFWRRSLWTQAGGYVDSRCDLAGDFELWARFFEHADLYGVDVPLSAFRIHGNQRSRLGRSRYVQQAREELQRHGGRGRHVVPGFLTKVACNLLPVSVVGGMGLLARGPALVRNGEAEWSVVERYLKLGGHRREAEAMYRRIVAESENGKPLA